MKRRVSYRRAGGLFARGILVALALAALWAGEFATRYPLRVEFGRHGAFVVGGVLRPPFFELGLPVEVTRNDWEWPRTVEPGITSFDYDTYTMAQATLHSDSHIQLFRTSHCAILRFGRRYWFAAAW